MSFFPQSKIKSNGNNFPQQNRTTGQFVGKIKAIREIKSNSNPTVFGVIELEVEGQPGVFQDYLNYNPNKAEQSVGFLVSHAKACVLSTGATVNADEEKDLNWVESTYRALLANQADIHFTQTADQNGRVSINYDAQQEVATF